MSLRILLIEDNPGDARLVIEAFSDLAEGKTVRLFHATTVAHGLAILAEMPLDAILLDLTLPDSSGLATLQRVYSLARQVPIILLTGTQDEEMAKAAMRNGAQDYLVKGEVDGRLLMRSIRYAIERKISEDNLRASEERYRILIEQASDGIFITDPDGKFLDVNSNGCLMLGYTREELLEMNMRGLSTSGMGSSMRGQWSDLVDGTAIILEHELTHRDGSVIPVEISAKILQDGRRQGIVRDIRARKQAEAALRESNDFNEMLIKTLPFQMDIVDENGVVLYVNPKMEATSRGELLGHSCWEINRTDQTQCNDCPLRLEIEIGKTNSLEVSGMRNGKIYNVTHTGMWYKGRKALMEVFQDMTERKQTEEKLRTSLQQLKFHDENSPLAVIEINSDFQITHWSGKAQQMFGWRADEVLTRNADAFSFVNDPVFPTINHFIVDMLDKKQLSTQHTSQNYRKDGTLIKCEWYSSALVDESGKLVSVQSLVLDITERDKAEQALRASEAFGQAILYSSPVGISVRNPFGKLLNCNDTWKKIWAKSEAEVAEEMNLSVSHLEFDDDANYLKKFQADVRKIYEQGGTLRVSDLKVPNPRPGEAGWISQQFYSIMDEQGRVDKVVILTEDISERKEAELALLKAHASLEQRVIDRTFELRTANVELEKAARMKDEFLASMSHELRTPLTGILGLSEALQMVTYGDLNEKQLRALKNIESSGRHLLSLINDMLDLSKIEAGMFEMQFASASLSGICQASLQMVKGLAQQKHQKIEFTIDPGTIVFRTDSRRLKQMLVNLLGNAIKFTPDGGTLGIEVNGLDITRQISITVWDTGIGIRPEDFSRLFQPFVQLDSSLSRQYAGTGLGLSLVKRLAELHGGQILVESTVGSGSRFTLLLPWVQDGTSPLQFSRRVTDRIRHSLTVEHDEQAAARLSILLKLIGVKNQVTLATLDAVDLAVQTWPDVIFIRESMPGVSGFELLAQLKADVRTQAIPVIILTNIENRIRARKLGADGVVIEPFAQVELHAELQRIAFNDTLGVLAVDAANASSRAARDLLVMVADDNPTIVELLTDFLQGNKIQVSAVSSGTDLLGSLSLVQPDLLLVDIQMPGMNGYDVINAIRAHPSPKISEMPIIAITALAMSGDRERCLAAGANEYMSKPLELKGLLDMIRALS